MFRFVIVLLGFALLAGACSSEPADEAWGAPAERYFGEWSTAWERSDAFDIVRFYDTDVAVGLAQDYRSLSLVAAYRGTAVSGTGRAWLVDWIIAQYEPRERSLVDTFVGSGTAVTVSTIGEIEGAVAVTMDLRDGLITSYTDLRWRDAHLEGGRPDVRVAWVDELVDAHLATWSDSGSASGAVGPGAAVVWFPEASVEPALTGAAIAQVRTGERSGPAVFLGDGLVAYVAEGTLEGCKASYLVRLSLDAEREVVAEERLPSVGSVRKCLAEDAPADGWWNDITIPQPVDQQVTGRVAVGSDLGITIINGVGELEQLLLWGLGQFEAAGLELPKLSSASFAPLSVCRDAPGVVIDSGDGGSDLVLCTDAYRVCRPDRESCTSFTTDGRLGMLHELAHAWLLANLDERAEADFLALRGLQHWASGAVPWHERGAEQAAEILAWGLMDEDIRLVRIGEPTCTEAAAAFAMLTGSQSLRDCG